MQQQELEGFAQRHADAVVSGDQAHMIADFVPEILPDIGPVAGALPQPTTSAVVRSVEVVGDEAVVRIDYSGADKTITIESRWAERDGRPKITAASVV